MVMSFSTCENADCFNVLKSVLDLHHVCLNKHLLDHAPNFVMHHFYYQKRHLVIYTVCTISGNIVTSFDAASSSVLDKTLGAIGIAAEVKDEGAITFDDKNFSYEIICWSRRSHTAPWKRW